MRLLHGGRTEPERSPREVADLVVNLPQGSAFWRAMGGAGALSDDALLLREVLFRLEVMDWHNGGSKGSAPKRLDLPKPADDVAASESNMTAKARRHAARAARTGGG